MARAYGYVRVSSGRQLLGDSIESQTEIIRRTWERELRPQGIDLMEPFFQESQSAYKNEFLRRPAGMLLNTRLQAGDHVLFAIHTRAFRRASDWSAMDTYWGKKGVRYHFCNVPAFGVVTSGAGWLTLAAMAAGAQMESEQRSLTTRSSLSYFRANTNRAWVREHYAFDKKVDHQGKKIFVPRMERLLDMYQWAWMREVGFTDYQIHNVTEKNRICREEAERIKYLTTTTTVCTDGRVHVTNLRRMMESWTEMMGNPYRRCLMPELEQRFKKRWEHLPYGVPDYRGTGSGQAIHHLYHYGVTFARGINRGKPACQFSLPARKLAPAYALAFQILAEFRPTGRKGVETHSPGNVVMGANLVS